jgi:hypothetical protein
MAHILGVIYQDKLKKMAKNTSMNVKFNDTSFSVRFERTALAELKIKICLDLDEICGI